MQWYPQEIWRVVTPLKNRIRTIQSPKIEYCMGPEALHCSRDRLLCSSTSRGHPPMLSGPGNAENQNWIWHLLDMLPFTVISPGLGDFFFFK